MTEIDADLRRIYNMAIGAIMDTFMPIHIKISGDRLEKIPATVCKECAKHKHYIVDIYVVDHVRPVSEHTSDFYRGYARGDGDKIWEGVIDRWELPHLLVNALAVLPDNQIYIDGSSDPIYNYKRLQSSDKRIDTIIHGCSDCTHVKYINKEKGYAVCTALNNEPVNNYLDNGFPPDCPLPDNM